MIYRGFIREKCIVRILNHSDKLVETFSLIFENIKPQVYRVYFMCGAVALLYLLYSESAFLSS